MRDPSTFEARLADAFEQYAVGAPVAIDSRQLAAAVGRHKQAHRPGRFPLAATPISRAWRLALVAAILAVAAVAGLLAAGAWRTRPPVPQPLGDSRLFVWLPSGGTRGTAVLLDDDGSILASRDMESHGCPTLVGGTESLAVPGSGSISIQTVDGRAVDGIPSGGLNTNYTGFERWAPDRSSIALVDAERGPITVVHLAPSSGDPETVRYGVTGELAGAIDASFSEDGSRLAVAVERAPGTVEIHVLQDGDDQLVRTIGPDISQDVRVSMSPAGDRVVVVEQAEGRPPRVIIVDVADGTISVLDDRVETGLQFFPTAWTPDGRTVAIRAGSGLLLLDVAAGTWIDTGMYHLGNVVDARWSTTPGRPGIAMLDDHGHLVVHVDGSRDRVSLLFGTDAAFSPDGSTVVSVGNRDGSRVYFGKATVMAVDVWGGRDPWVLASLPAPATFANAEGSPAPCVDWLPGGAP
jgi:hypothetical protein